MRTRRFVFVAIADEDERDFACDSEGSRFGLQRLLPSLSSSALSGQSGTGSGAANSSVAARSSLRISASWGASPSLFAIFC